MSRLPHALVESLRLRQAVLVAGGRCSALAGSPDWAALAAALADRLEDPPAREEARALLAAGRRLAALARLREALPDPVIAEALRAAVAPGREIPGPIAAAAAVPFRGVVTTALDDVWERALAADGRVPTTVVPPGGALALDGFRGRFLLPLLGRAADEALPCLSPREVRARLGGGRAALLHEAHRRYSFVLVGFAPGDPDLALAAGLLGASGSAREHFWLLPGVPADEAAVAGLELGCTPVVLDGGVAEALEGLAEAWRAVEATSRPAEDDVAGWLERWTRDPADPEPPEVLARAADRMRRDGSWQPLVELLVHRAELAGDRSDQIRSLRELARILDAELGAPERAYSALVTALRLAPEEGALLDELKRLARKANLWEDFLDEYGGFVEEISDPTDSARHVVELGRIYAEEGGRDDRAIASFERALALDPGAAEALVGLEGLYRKAGRWADLARVLHERERRASEPAEARRLRRERARLLLDRLDDPSGAAEAFAALAAEEPEDREALRALERLHAAAGRTPELLAVQERLLGLAESDEERLRLARALARGHRDRPGGQERALAALERAFALGDRDEETLEPLARALEGAGRFRECVAVLERWAEVAPEGRARAQLLARAGRLLAEALADPEAGEQRALQALEHDPDNAEVLAQLAAASAARGDHLRAAKFLRESAERTRNPLEKARRLHEAAVLCAEHLGDEPRAVELWTRALAADPEHVPAAERLAALHERAERWAELEPLLELLARKADPQAPATADLHLRLAGCARRNGRPDRALRSYEAARALAPEAPGVLRGLAELHLERGAFADARALYMTLRRVAEGALAPAERGALYERLARCEAGLEEHEAARRWLAEAVALALPADDQARIWEQMGDLCLERLGRPEDAIHAFQQVLQIQPNRRQTLHKILELYTGHKRWPGAVATLAQLAALEPAPAVRAKYHYASAVIHRDELGAPDTALELFNRALDEDPEMTRAFDAIERLLTEAQDWKGLARAYRKMIKRLPAEGQEELRARLWNGLGVVSLRFLDDREAAVLAFEVAASLEPEDLARRALLADLYVQAGPSALEKAVAEHQFLVARQPDRIESYRVLARLYQQMQAYDRLWCVAGALTYLGEADHYLQQFWERHRLGEVPVAAGKLTQELWQKVVHPDEDPFLSALFGLLAPALAMTCAQTHAAAGLRRAERVDVGRDDWFPAVALRYVSATLDQAPPDLFVRDKDPQTVAIQNLRDKAALTPALVIGRGFQQWATQHEVVFDLAKRMAFLRWERFPRFALLTPASLDIAVRAALALGGCPIGDGPHDGEVERTRGKLAQLVPQPAADQLAALARQFVEARGPVVDIPAWIAAADLSAARAAFVLSTDLPAAYRVLSAEPAGMTPLPLPERLKDLLAYSVSEPFFAVREALGLQVV